MWGYPKPKIPPLWIWKFKFELWNLKWNLVGVLHWPPWSRPHKHYSKLWSLAWDMTVTSLLYRWWTPLVLKENVNLTLSYSEFWSEPKDFCVEDINEITCSKFQVTWTSSGECWFFYLFFTFARLALCDNSSMNKIFNYMEDLVFLSGTFIYQLHII